MHTFYAKLTRSQFILNNNIKQGEKESIRQ